jgi:alanyl-tRNA synthetase
VTIDVDSEELSSIQLHEIENEVNKQIYENRPIHTYFVTFDEMQKLPLLKMPKVTEGIRIVEIEGIEHNACGGTHVARTGEIGLIKLFKTEKQRGNTRIFFKCGQRALNEFHENLEIMNDLSAKFNTNREDVLNRLEKWEDNQKQLEMEVSLLKEQLNHYQSKDLLVTATDGLVAHVFEDKSFNDMKELAVKLANDNGLFILFLTASENKVILAQSGNHPILCGTFLKEHLSEFNGKGGGNDKTAQAAFSSKEDAEKFYHFANHQISGK